MNTRKVVQNFFIFSLLILFLIACVAMVYPFFTILLWTILLYIIFRPLHAKIATKINRKKKFYSLKRNLLAALFSFGILILIITPLIFMCFFLIKEFISFSQQLITYLNEHPKLFTSEGPFAGFYKLIEEFEIDIPNFEIKDIRDNIIQLIQNYSSKVLSIGTSILSRTSNFVISLVFVVFALFFCFLDGHYLATILKKAIPVERKYMDILIDKFTRITKNLFSGYILVALYQGIVAFIIMLIFKVQGALLFSVILMFASFIPIFGTALVWFPIGIVMCFTKSLFLGCLFILLCGIFVSLLDNFIRPILLKDRINVHPLIIFFAILGGIEVFGLNGLILGPLIVILFFTLLDMLLDNNISDSDTEEKEEKSEVQNS